MRRHPRPIRQSIVSRRGLTLLELLSCIVALAGGVWLGALYLGVDVQTLVRGALEQANILPPADDLEAFSRESSLDGPLANALDTADTSLPAAAGENGNGATGQTFAAGIGASLDEGDTASTPPLDEATSLDDVSNVELLKQELANLRNAVTQLRSGGEVELPPAVADTSQGGKSSLDTKLSQRLSTAQRDAIVRRSERTYEYWMKLLATVEEARGSSGPLSNLKLAAELQRRAAVFSRAARTINALSTADVDAEAVQFAKKLVRWYQSGIQLLEQAEFQLYRTSMQQFRAAPGAVWGTAERQHLKEAELLVRLSKEAAAQLTQSYQRVFPSL